MKELRILVRVRNNLLRERRRAAGLTLKQFARRARVPLGAYSRIENMTDAPRRVDGSWSRVALRVARYHQCPVEVLFPAGVEAVRRPTIVRKVDVAEVGRLLESSTGAKKLLPPGTRMRGDAVRRVLVEEVNSKIAS